MDRYILDVRTNRLMGVLLLNCPHYLDGARDTRKKKGIEEWRNNTQPFFLERSRSKRARMKMSTFGRWLDVFFIPYIHVHEYILTA